MKSLIDTLPGISMPVEDVSATLAKMWDADGRDGVVGQSDFRASQMNLILHFGLKTSATEALATFEQAVKFAQRYPCRLIVLCPSAESKGDRILEGKLYSQCFIGNDLRDLCCCEGLILGYSIEESNFLENQVSLWLESDLPTYHWFHRVPSDRINAFYLPFLKRCRRILVDTSIEGERDLGVFWPDPDRVRDLAKARTLPFRQHIGQFLSSYDPQTLIDGLERIEFSYCENLKYEIFHLMNWHQVALSKCFAKGASGVENIQLVETNNCENSDTITIHWYYKNTTKKLCWHFNDVDKTGRVESLLNSIAVDNSLHIERLSASKVLAEALFF